MSAEKDIVNYWYNRKGFFTISNIKTNNNKDVGILALKFDRDRVIEVFHIEVSCSITNNAEEKFEDAAVAEKIGEYVNQFSLQKQKIKRIIVIGSIPKSKKNEMIEEFVLRNVEVIGFDDVLYDVLEHLDTQYHKNSVIRTLQLIKFLLLSEPTKMAKLAADNSFTSSSRNEFLSGILDKEEIMKEFRKTNAERLSSILKNSNLKPAQLAGMLDRDILNNRTRKTFLNSFMEQENIRKIADKSKRVKKVNVPLGKFF